jgi:hypothetical protein
MLQIEALQEVLKKLKSKRIPIYEKKYGQVPMVRLRVPFSLLFHEKRLPRILHTVFTLAGG